MKLISSLDELDYCVKCKVISKGILLLCALLCLAATNIKGQTHLEIEHSKLFGSRTSTVHAFVRINIKTKTNEKLNHLIITGFSDSAFVFKDHAPIKYSELKRIAVIGDRPLCSLFGKFFKRFGVAFFALNTVNQAITGNTPVFEIQALYIGGSVFALGSLLRSFENKRIRIGEETKFTTIVVNYSEVN